VAESETPKVFVSYSHESEAHTRWVRRLAEDLTKKGVDTTLDHWHLHVGDDIGAFMEQSLSKATFVVLVCTEIFRAKSKQKRRRCWYEQALYVGEMLVARTIGSRFLPIIRSGVPSSALPLYLQSRLFVDFRDDSTYGDALDQLLRRICGNPAFTPPPLGKREHPQGAGSPRAWVLVAGTGSKWRKLFKWRKLNDKLQQTCMVLGETLARSGYGLVTGGWPGVDELTARSFARELDRQGSPLEDRLIQVVVDDELPAFPAGNLVLVRRGEEEWTEPVKRSDAVVLIGGFGGTRSTGEYALKFGRIVFPLADTGVKLPSSTCICNAIGNLSSRPELTARSFSG
jgi:TIR domain